GGLQGFIGWFMVQSGLDESSLLYVSHIRLSIHFISALILLCYTLWFALKLLIPPTQILYQPKIKNYFLILTGILTLQLFYGAFMSGLHAALVAPTWPKMVGYWIPPKLMELNWIHHPTAIQFVHRGLAYILVLLTLYGSYKLWSLAKNQNHGLLKKMALWPSALIVIQLLLGIFTLLSSPYIEKGKFGLYETLAEVHQVVAMCLLISIFVVLYLIRGKSKYKTTTSVS